MRDDSAAFGHGGAEVRWSRFGMLAALAAMVLPLVVVGASTAQAAVSTCAGQGTSLATLCVESSTNGATTPPYVNGVVAGQRIDEFKWLVSTDNTGDPSLTPDNVAKCLPARAKTTVPAIYATAGDHVSADGRQMSDCPWPSIHAVEDHSPVIATGTQDDIGRLASLIPGKYLISVTAADFKIDGVHFEVGASGSLVSVNEIAQPDGRFVVRMNPLPKKTATIRVHVYNDNASTNGQWDGQTETLLTCADATPAQQAANCAGQADPNLVADPTTDMSGFSVSINDVLATVTTDVYGNPLCTQYLTDANGNVILDDYGTPTPVTFGDGGASGGFLSGTESTCLSDHYGDIVIPNMGPNRYAVSVTPPDPRTHNGVQWVQTTTLEGGHDWDSWNIEGGTGYDTELIVGGERVTPVAHGFVALTHNDEQHATMSDADYYDASGGFTTPTGENGVLDGHLVIGRAYIGSGAGAPLAGFNLTNSKIDGVIEDGIVSISCIATCSAPTDSAVWTGRAKADGTFSVHGLQAGDYTVAMWDETQSYILATMQYSIGHNETTHAGDVLLSGWFTDVQGSVFVDTDGNGVRDPGERGVPDFFLSVRTRGNSLQDQGAATAMTNDSGDFDLSQAYPLNQFLILEAYNPRFKTTGVTYLTDNDVAHTMHTSQVDFNFLPVIGLSVKVDVGVQPYLQDENGGIAGTVTYDVTRNEFDPAFSAAEDYQPSIPDIPMQLWKTKKDAAGNILHYGETHGAITEAGDSGAAIQLGIDRSGAECQRSDSSRGTDAVQAGQGCLPYDYYVTETWTRPTGCMALDVNGDKLQGELALPDSPDSNAAALASDPNYFDHSDPAKADCIDAPMNGLQFGGDGSVDGNYALTNLLNATGVSGAPVGGGDALAAFYADKDAAANWDTLTPADYVVESVNPVDAVGATDPVLDADQGGYMPAGGAEKRIYRYTDETSINVFSGDTYVPRDGYTGTGSATDPGFDLGNYSGQVVRQDVNTLGAGTVAKCAGTLSLVVNDTPDFAAGGGTPYEGEKTPVCDAKVVKVVNGRSVNPTFFMYTDVPIPAKFYGLLNDDLNVQTDRRSIILGEVAPLANGPIGIYDENGNWKYTAHSDMNGNYEVIVPSMDTYNCPLPAGPCPNVYRLVGNDPGTLDHRNLDYDPQFRTIATEFQAWTGVTHPVDQAPTHQSITIEGPASQFGALSLCKVNDPTQPLAPITPEIYAINRPYFDPGSDRNASQTTPTVFTLDGAGFGVTKGSGQLLLGTTPIPTTSWSDTQVTFSVPGSLVAGGYQLSVRSGNGLSTVNGLTFHRLSSTSDNTYFRRSDVYEVRSNDANGAPIATDNAGNRIYTPMHDAWDTVTDTPAGFSGQDANSPRQNVDHGRAIQRAVEAAHSRTASDNRAKLVVIYPNTAPNYAPHNAGAAYFENVVLHSKVTLQGVGPGGAYTSTRFVNGTDIDASTYWSATQVVPPGANQDTSDGSYSDDWRTFANALPRAGQGLAELPEGEAVLAIAESPNQWAPLTVTINNGPNRGTYDDLSVTRSRLKAGIDGIVLSGGDQQGNPGNVNTAPGAGGGGSTFGGNPGPAQGGAIMLDQYVRDFNITNNLIQANGGTYGTVRIGTPDLGLTAAEQDNHDERLNVANNRFVANGGTNLAGALGLFYGTDLYTVTGNDFCGNFSAEYGGAISHYGASAGGSITKNRIYYNQSYDEGGGIMIAGNLPANNAVLSDGAGGTYTNGFTGTGSNRQAITVRAGVTVDSNVLVSNQSNDDGGGVRLLMAGNFPFVLSNNVIANNLSTHEGGGIALDDAPNVTIVNNTVVKNVTTATAATNSSIVNLAGVGINAITPAGAEYNATAIVQLAQAPAQPQNPAGLATGGNSPELQATLPSGSPNWSKPVLVNNIFADNRAGYATFDPANFNANAIKAIGELNGSTPSQRWDIGVSATGGLCNQATPQNTCITPAFGFTGTNNTTNTSALDHTVAGSNVYVAPDNIAGTTDGTATVGFQHAVDFLVDSLGWRVNTNVSYPVIVAQMVPITLLADYHLLSTSSTTYAVDRGTNPGAGSPVPTIDLDGQGRPQGAATDRGADEIRGVTADLSVTKDDGKTAATPGATSTYTIVVTNNGPDAVTGATVADTLPAALTGATWTCTGSCSATSGTGNIGQTINLSAGASATYSLTATVAAGTTGAVSNTATVTSAVADPTPGNNSATDTDQTPPARPTLPVLDNFNRANAINLGASWNQANNNLRVNANQAFGNSTGNAVWGASFGARQAAAFTVSVGSPAVVSGDSLILKQNGLSWIRVRATSTQIVVEYTNSGGVAIPLLGIPAYTTLATWSSTVGNTSVLTALAEASGVVTVWNGTALVGTVSTTFTGAGRIGISLPTGGRIDDFAGGTVAP